MMFVLCEPEGVYTLYGIARGKPARKSEACGFTSPQS